MKLKKGDKVKITAGKDRGKEGKIENVLPKEKKVIVPEVNLYKKHVKGQQGQKGGMFDLPRPLSVAKIALICPKCKKQTRIGIRLVKNEKVRICKKCNKEIDTGGKNK
ncbi:50S ribosomal protein L24 [Candidatus Microgenomates bacterium]|nr:50S ribosomal protein L24 [Candidatus Microgenomates bacterium]